MLTKDLIEKIKDMARVIASSHGFELVELNYYYMANSLILRVFIDRPSGGINIDECALVNGELGQALDDAGLIDERYTLEVSSPGIDRVLKTKDDFKRIINRNVFIILKESIKGKNEIKGMVKSVDDNLVYMKVGLDEFEVPFDKIIKAKQIIDYD